MDKFAQIESAAHSGAHGQNAKRLPTDAQHKAGNYAKGRVRVYGLPIVIEQPRNSYREGVDPNGVAWRTRMAHHYGYISGTHGADGDEVDTYLGMWPESSSVFVVNQNAPDTGEFDEHKVMLCFLDQQQAEQGYRDSYSKDWQGMGDVVPCTVEQFKWWLKNGDTTKPFATNSLPENESAIMDSITWNTSEEAPAPVGMDISEVLYKLRQNDPDGLVLDPMSMADVMGEAEAEIALDALVLPYGQLNRKMVQLQRVLGQAAGGVKPVGMTVSKPFKLRGVINVAVIFELSDGQTITIWFHSGGSNPSRVQQTDELISWKWALNKKDITILVAKENGQELNPRLVARRVMAVANKNSPRFAKINENRAERLNSIEVLKRTADEKHAKLEEMQKEVVELTHKVEEHKAKVESKKTTIQPYALGQQAYAAGSPRATPPSFLAVFNGAGLADAMNQFYKGWDTAKAAAEASQPTANDPHEHHSLPEKEVEALREIGATQEEIDRVATGGTYAAFAANPDNQDLCDHLMSGRIVEIRNSLRDIGWSGFRGEDLTKSADFVTYTIDTDTSPSSSTYNVTNFAIKVKRAGVTVATIPNDMSKLGAEIAEQIDAILPKKAEQAAAAEPEKSEPVAAAVEIDDYLPEGWTEATKGGMATNKDPVNGGIIDKNAVSGEWFVIPENDAITNMEGFATRKEAFDMLAKAVAMVEENSSVVINGDNGISITVAKTKYRDNEWGVSYASTNIASASSKAEGIEIANRVIASGAENIVDMRAAAIGEQAEASEGLSKERQTEIAKTILAQLGGNKFATMTGAKNFASLPEGGLQFSLPANFAKSGINLVTITLNLADLYDIVYYKKRGVAMKEMLSDDNVHVADLRRTFKDATGLDVSLGTVLPTKLETVAAVQALGVATITDVGEENVYIEKGGAQYAFKTDNTERYAVGEYDFSNDNPWGEVAASEPDTETKEKNALDSLSMMFADFEEKSGISLKVAQRYVLEKESDAGGGNWPVTKKFKSKFESWVEMAEYFSAALPEYVDSHADQIAVVKAFIDKGWSYESPNDSFYNGGALAKIGVDDKGVFVAINGENIYLEGQSAEQLASKVDAIDRGEVAPPAAANGVARDSFEAFEGAVTDIVADQLEATYSDAHGVVMAQESILSSGWDNKETPDATAAKIMAASSNGDVVSELVEVDMHAAANSGDLEAVKRVINSAVEHGKDAVVSVLNALNMYNAPLYARLQYSYGGTNEGGIILPPEKFADFFMNTGGNALAEAQAVADADPIQEDQADTASDAQRDDDTAYLQSVIDGTADMMGLEIADRLTAIHDDYQGDDAVMQLFNDAANAYSNYMVNQAKAALA